MIYNIGAKGLFTQSGIMWLNLKDTDEFIKKWNEEVKNINKECHITWELEGRDMYEYWYYSIIPDNSKFFTVSEICNKIGTAWIRYGKNYKESGDSIFNSEKVYLYGFRIEEKYGIIYPVTNFDINYIDTEEEFEFDDYNNIINNKLFSR